MSDDPARPSTAFQGTRRLHSGPLTEVALVVKTAAEGSTVEPLLVFDDATGRVIDLDLRGSEADVLARLGPRTANPAPQPEGAPAAEHRAASAKRGPGRPKLGVVAREVTLLPRHWEWLSAQPSGASAAIRRLVDEARRRMAPQQQRRAAQEAAYRFMAAIAGDLPEFEEATRALFADDPSGFAARLTSWPEDVRAYALHLAFPTPGPSDPELRSPTERGTP